MDVILELLLEFFGQVVLEILLEVFLGLADLGTHGRKRQVLLFTLAGAAAGFGSYFVRPTTLMPDPLIRYAIIAALTLGGGIVLALFESRIRRGGPGAATSGFLSGAGFSLAYALVRRLLLA
jgi:peptidoglycan/LPS O-acetylase OafA/YrhL